MLSLCSPPFPESRLKENFKNFRMSTLVVRTWTQLHKKMPRCASDDRGATPVNTIWPSLTVQAMTQRINVGDGLLYVIQYRRGRTPKSQTWQSETIKPNNRRNMAKSCCAQDVQLNLAMPRLASNDRGPAPAFSFWPCLAVQVMTKGQHRYV